MTKTIKLTIEKTFDAAPAKVMAAWTDPMMLAKWFAPGTRTLGVDSYELRPGGDYRLRMVGAETYTVFGKFRSVTPTSLEFTWNWVEYAMANDTVVKVEVAPKGKGCLMTLTHTEFPTAQDLAQHQEGWEACLVKFSSALV